VAERARPGTVGAEHEAARLGPADLEQLAAHLAQQFVDREAERADARDARDGRKRNGAFGRVGRAAAFLVDGDDEPPEPPAANGKSSSGADVRDRFCCPRNRTISKQFQEVLNIEMAEAGEKTVTQLDRA
jgi:hypothetical protein